MVKSRTSLQCHVQSHTQNLNRCSLSTILNLSASFCHGNRLHDSRVSMETDLLQKLSQGTDVLDGVHVEMTNVRGVGETTAGDIYALLSPDARHLKKKILL